MRTQNRIAGNFRVGKKRDKEESKDKAKRRGWRGKLAKYCGYTLLFLAATSVSAIALSIYVLWRYVPANGGLSPLPSSLELRVHDTLGDAALAYTESLLPLTGPIGINMMISSGSTAGLVEDNSGNSGNSGGINISPDSTLLAEYPDGGLAKLMTEMGYLCNYTPKLDHQRPDLSSHCEEYGEAGNAAQDAVTPFTHEVAFAAVEALWRVSGAMEDAADPDTDATTGLEGRVRLGGDEDTSEKANGYMVAERLLGLLPEWHSLFKQGQDRLLALAIPLRTMENAAGYITDGFSYEIRRDNPLSPR